MGDGQRRNAGIIGNSARRLGQQHPARRGPRQRAVRGRRLENVDANSATGTGTETRQNGGTAIALGTAWVEPTSGLVAGAALPVANTTGWSVSTWGSPTPGMLTFSGTPASGIAISADFTYYFPCRFDDPQITFKKILAAIFSADSIEFSTEK